MDLGTGTGINIKYYPTGQITKLICVEPNRAFHSELLRNAEKAGFDRQKMFLTGESAQADIPGSALADVPNESVDTIIALSCLCSIPHPQVTIKTLREKLKPGGKFLFSEHVKSTEKSTITYQNVIKPVWFHLLGNCDVTRPTGDWILNEKWVKFCLLFMLRNANRVDRAKPMSKIRYATLSLHNAPSHIGSTKTARFEHLRILST